MLDDPDFLANNEELERVREEAIDESFEGFDDYVNMVLEDVTE